PERRRLHRLPARALSSPPGPVRPAPARGLMDHTLGGPEMAPDAQSKGATPPSGLPRPPRSSRPGKAGMLLDLLPIALVVLAGLATLAFPLILRILMDFLGYQEVAIPMMRTRPVAFMQFSDPRAYDVLALGALAATLVLSHWIETSRLGYALRALKENEQAAEA